MRFAVILAATAATMVAAQDFSKCKDMSGLVDCATPYSNAISDCKTTDLDCLCKNANSSLDCFNKYCPEVDFPNQDIITNQCSSSGNADSNSGDKKSGGGDQGAAASLFAPAGGMIAAIAAAVAML